MSDVSTNAPQAKYRNDYQAPLFAISETDLVFELDDHQTMVTNTMKIQRVGEDSDLVLVGENVSLLKVTLDGRILGESDYTQTEKDLRIHQVPDAFVLEVMTQIDPANNSALEGLYKSAGTFCTQCEAEGFRRISYYLDRPDVLSVFTTKIVAPKQGFPYLLANGNPIAHAANDTHHSVTWHDPHPKPAYLFALVAGDFDVLEDHFETQDGRDVLLQIFVDKGNLSRAQYAMDSLKRSMAWDEERFGLVYDLDIYMIVAVDFFNMGAMENKGLNIFNSKYVLADAKTATDQDFINVESVIGHEYFHNWTGNRVTCRDWFQLSLKEGLTVFRDQEFSADMGMRSVQRIQDVRIIRSHQFEEDAGPMAHPIRPDRVMEMNNFYTVTVYNKGAEVIRMLHTLLGENGFQAGMRLYIDRHDGQAVTCEDFIKAMEDANSADFSQFRHWYAYAGTPQVQVHYDYDVERQEGSLVLTQTTPDTPDQKDKPAFHIPIQVEFIDDQGVSVEVHVNDSPLDLIELTEREQCIRFKGPKAPLIPALLGNFSAPIKLIFEQNEDELLAIMRGASDPFLRWDASQRIYRNSLLTAIHEDTDVGLSEAMLDTLSSVLKDAKQDAALTALLLQIPNEETLAQEFDIIPVADVVRVVGELRALLALALKDELMFVWERTDIANAGLDSALISQRMLANTALGYLAFHHDDAQISSVLKQQFYHSASMTLTFGALAAAVHADHPLCHSLLDDFAKKWQGHALVMDKWLAVQASAPDWGSAERIDYLTHHSAFNWTNPNRIYALLASFTHNLGQLHAQDGLGYQLLESAITRLNASNPQVASRLLSPLLKWKRLPEALQTALHDTLVRLRKLNNLAPDLHEKLSQALEEK
ncbi:aminopeptidase N [Aliidiomarina halalkaliphila]|uniref:Aminopeptidase N n=1 Tax=Aliidiomarina halalkaliphila TaxID=2593535 RepID=A0A552X491_9GAMM|nr:aminopeptidase N [Aliidiomarina halalkaliphila]TRW49729.1 aminopeptidase N [Aliidiomarina halalkaliphila]